MLTPSQWRAGGGAFEFRGHRLVVRSEGRGAALLLIHGFPTSSWDWARLWPELAKDFRLLTLDMLGFGASDKPPEFPYSIVASADQWQAWVASQGVEEVLILAHDYGDSVAQ